MAGELREDEPEAGIVRLTVVNPAKHGALDHAILDALADAVGRADRGGALAILVRGEGGRFSSGYDISDLEGEDADVFASAAEALVAHPFSAAVDALLRTRVPTVAAIGGPAIGGGLELAVACDLRVCAAGVTFGMPPAKLGLVYSHTGLARFLEVVGEPRTRELFLLGERIEAARAEAWGLVNRVVAAGDLEDEGLGWARRLAANAPLAQRGNKRVLRALLDAQAALDEATLQELLALRRASFDSEDMREGIAAFAQKRPARWRGR